MNILYIGSSGALSLLPFKKLLSSGHDVVAVGVFNPVVINDKVIALENESLSLAATQHDITLVDLSRSVDSILEQCKNITIDIILMSCYGRRLPEAIINMAAKGSFNMHPSLLPQYRGPEPVFWQMKHASDMGVSWHQVVNEIDAGDVVAQKKVFVEDAATYDEICLQLAETGAAMLPKILSALAEDELQYASQEPASASYYPYPLAKDCVIDTQLSAQEIFNYMRATQKFSYPYIYQVGNYQYFIEHALDYDNNLSLDTVEVQADRLYIPCKKGILIVTYTDRINH